MSETKFTPGEWRRRGSGVYTDVKKRDRLVAEAYAPEGRRGEMEANAERIVLCCNAHDDLVAALMLAEATMTASIDSLPNDCGIPMALALVSIRKALAKAGEK